MRTYMISSLVGLVLLLFIGCNSRQPTNETHIVEIKQMKFIPAKIKVAPGDSVKWINKDIVAHNVAEEKDNLWESTNLQNGDSFTIEVKKDASYLCTIHPVMKGEILLNN